MAEGVQTSVPSSWCSSNEPCCPCSRSATCIRTTCTCKRGGVLCSSCVPLSLDRCCNRTRVNNAAPTPQEDLLVPQPVSTCEPLSIPVRPRKSSPALDSSMSGSTRPESSPDASTICTARNNCSAAGELESEIDMSFGSSRNAVDFRDGGEQSDLMGSSPAGNLPVFDIDAELEKV